MRAHLGQTQRYAHTVRVARLADRLAQTHAEDPGRARLAGMLHDLARLYSAERLVAECEARGMPIDPFERRHPVVLLADGLEPGRAFPERAQFEALAFRDLEGAMLALLRLSIAHLRGRGLEAAPLTLAALAAYERDERSPLSA